MKHRPFIVLFLVLFAAVLTACGGSAAPEQASAPQGTTLEVVAYDIYFGEDADNLGNPPVWTAEAGSLATVTFENKGGLEHNWAVVKQGEEIPAPFEIENHSDLILYDTGVVQPGEQKSFPFQVPDEPGEYTVICTVSGHYPIMQGRLVVS
jgi:plastocyanin